MWSRIGRQVAVTMTMAVPLLVGGSGLGLALASTTGPTTAAVSISPPQVGDTLNTWLRRSLAPNARRDACIRTTAEDRRGDGTPARAVQLGCNPGISLQGIPASVPSGWQTHPSSEFVTFLMNRTGASASVARSALATPAGINTWELPQYTVGTLAQRIATRMTTPASALATELTPSTGERRATTNAVGGGTTICGNTGTCGVIEGSGEAIFWGAAIGYLIGGGLGAAIGAALGALWGWLFP